MQMKLLCSLLFLNSMVLGMHEPYFGYNRGQLEQAAEDENLQRMAEFIPHVSDQDIGNVLCVAAAKGCTESVKLLRQNNAWYRKHIVLNIAIENGNLPIVKIMLDSNLLNPKKYWIYQAAQFTQSEIKTAHELAIAKNKTEIAAFLKSHL